jgi:hypothetical protein
MAVSTWTANRRIYLDQHGRAVEADDPARASLLVPAGGTLPLERARALGLVADPEPPAPAGKPSPKNKLKAAPDANKDTP